MCKHVLNAQVSLRTPCCKKWYDCLDCHAAAESHPLLQRPEIAFACKKCRKCFRKDTSEWEEADEYCPHCDNHFVIDAIIPKPVITLEGDSRMVRDDRVKRKDAKEASAGAEDGGRLG